MPSTAGTAEHRARGHHRAGTDPVEQAAGPDPDQRGDHESGRERRGDRGDRPPGVCGDGRGEDGEGVVEHAPADDLGARTGPRATRRSPTSVNAAGLRRLAVASSPSHSRGGTGAEADRRPGRTAAAQQPPSDPASSVWSNRPAAAADPGLGQHQLDPGGGLVVPGQRRGDRADLLVAGHREERRRPAVALHPDQVTRPARAGPARRRRAGRPCRRSARSGRSAGPARAGPAEPGPGPGAPPTATTGPGGTRSPRRPRRPGRAAARPPTPAPAGRRPRWSTAAVRNPVTVEMCPASTAAAARWPRAPRAGKLVGVAAAEGVADCAAAQQPHHVRVRAPARRARRTPPAPSAPSARCRRPRPACPA